MVCLTSLKQKCIWTHCSFKVCHFLGAPKLEKVEDTIQQPYSKQEMAWQTVFYANLMVAVHARSGSIVSRPVMQLFEHTVL